MAASSRCTSTAASEQLIAALARGFASHGQREFGFSVEDIKLILDHSEGAASNDVTASNYALDPMIAKKREMMEKWIAWLEL